MTITSAPLPASSRATARPAKLAPQITTSQSRSIGVRSDGFGRPAIELSGSAEELARARGVKSLDVSLTHEGPFAAAVVVAQFGGAD